MSFDDSLSRRFTPGPVLLALALALPLAAPAADGPPPDPLDSPQWETMHRAYLAGGPVRFDERVKVRAPSEAEDSMNVPIAVDARALGDVEEILVFVDLNPIPKVLSYFPVNAAPYVSFRVKLQQSSPVHAAARTADGVWHVGGVNVDAAGGGCTVASVGRASDDWSDRLGEVHGRLWAREGGSRRLRMRVQHPMDTGLADGIPAFYLERLAVHDGEGRLLARVQTYEPLSANPVLSLDLAPGDGATGAVSISGVDNNGNPVEARIEP